MATGPGQMVSHVRKEILEEGGRAQGGGPKKKMRRHREHDY